MFGLIVLTILLVKSKPNRFVDSRMSFFFCSNSIQNVEHRASVSNVWLVGHAPNAREVFP